MSQLTTMQKKKKLDQIFARTENLKQQFFAHNINTIFTKIQLKHQLNTAEQRTE